MEMTSNSPININQMMTTVYNTIMSLQKSAADLVGLDTLWCRALPHKNSEDVVIQEYTLYNVECPKQLRVISNTQDYNPGQMMVDMYGLNYEQPLEISIDIQTWEKVFGKHTMPQRKDIVYVILLNRFYQVKSSSIIYQLNNRETGFKVILDKYNTEASRKEPEDIKNSINELIDNQTILFGDDISREVADAAVEVETSYEQSTTKDKFKSFDINSIVTKDIVVSNGNLISHAYYNFANATQPVKYNISAHYDKDDKFNHWIFTSWFQFTDDNVQEGTFRFVDIEHKEKQYWYFKINTSLQLEEGTQIIISRGSSLKMTADVVSAEYTSNGHLLRIKYTDVLIANKKLQNWYNSNGLWKIRKTKPFNLFTGFSGVNQIVKFDFVDNVIMCKINDQKFTLQIFNNVNVIVPGNWYYIALDICFDQIHIIICEEKETQIKTIKSTELINKTFNIRFDNFDVDTFEILNDGLTVNMTNIRLYENQTDIDDSYKYDMYSMVTRNANKLILVDTPNIANEMTFVSKIR